MRDGAVTPTDGRAPEIAAAREMARRLIEARRDPNLFIVGAQKCGTTALAADLEADPAVFLTAIKEPNFFARDVRPELFAAAFRHLHLEDEASALGRSERERVLYAYLSDPASYEALYAGAAGHQVRGEASVTYLYSEHAAEAIAACFPGARIVAVLRDPIARAHSHFRMQQRAGVETETDFVTAVLRDHAEPTHVWGRKHLYVEVGRYARQLRRYLAAFPPEQVLVLDFDDLFLSPTGAGRLAVRSFLGLGPPAAAMPVENAGATPRFHRLNGLLYRSGLKRLVQTLLPAGLRQAGKRLYYGGSSRGAPDEERARLAPLFAEDAEELQALLGRPMPWTLPKPVPEPLPREDHPRL